MQITFDPTDKREADYVRKMLGVSPSIETHDVAGATFISKELQERAQTIAHEDRPDVGAAAPSAAPLAPPAPSTAAVDLFPTVPVVPVASIPPAPPVPSPPAVTVPPAPPVPAASASPANPAELDEHGLPWDERIHAGTKAKNADGSWRQRRGLNDEALIKRVEAELRQLVANNATSVAPLPPVPPAPSAATVSVPPPPVTPAGPPAVPAPPVPAGAPTPTIPPAPPAAPPASTPAPEINFYQLLDVITKSISAGKLTEAQINEQLAAEGIQPTEIGLLAGDAAKVQAIGNRLHALLGA